MAYMKRGGTPPKKGKGSKLSPKMKAFIDEFFVDLNGAAAVLRAGYKTRNPSQIASELRAHPLVSAEIEKRQAERSEKLELSADFVINKLVSIVEKTEEGNPTAALRGLELLGKHLSLFTDKQEISGPDGEAIKMEQKTNENVADFTSSLSRLIKRNGTKDVVEFPDPAGDSKA